MLPVVYVLEDDRAAQAIVAKTLRTAGFEVVASDQWPLVSQQLLGDPRDAILVCDLGLVGIRGEDFCRVVQQHRPDITVVLFSGAEGDEVNRVSQRLGGVPWLLKAQGVEALRDLLRSLHRSRSGKWRAVLPREDI